MFALQIENPQKNVTGVIITTTSLSEVAKKYSKKLKINFIENTFFDKSYPCIKCNVSRKNGEKIYHLPFDQQYDKIVIETERGEFYANTVNEAEERGFRRAYKWIPEK